MGDKRLKKRLKMRENTRRGGDEGEGQRGCSKGMWSWWRKQKAKSVEEACKCNIRSADKGKEETGEKRGMGGGGVLG